MYMFDVRDCFRERERNVFIIVSIYSIMYLCFQEVFNDTKITISGLSPVTTYLFSVFAENGVSALAEHSESVDITVTTEASVQSSVQNVRATNVQNMGMTIEWDPPAATDGSDTESDVVEIYEVVTY